MPQRVVVIPGGGFCINGLSGGMVPSALSLRIFPDSKLIKRVLSLAEPYSDKLSILQLPSPIVTYRYPSAPNAMSPPLCVPHKAGT